MHSFSVIPNFTLMGDDMKPLNALPFFLLSLTITASVVIAVDPPSRLSLCHPDQRDALSRFNHSFLISGPLLNYLNSFCINTSYPKTSSWREDEDCCSWEGVTCDNSTGDVVGLDLSCASLLGTIDSRSSVFSLPHLRSLSLARNYLTGIIPTEISRLSKLVSLNLSGNGLEIQNPTMRVLVSNLTHLEELDLSFNSMSTVIPTSLMNFSSSLISLNLSDCWLRGTFPDYVFQLPNLQLLDLSLNFGLHGTLPKSNWSTSLAFLSIGECSFAGEVPRSIGTLPRLTSLDLSWNNFTGHVDVGTFSTQKNLRFLRLSGVSVSGEDANLSFPQLQELHMVSCNLTKFPSFLSQSNKLTYLDLMGNMIEEIPSWFWGIGIDTLEFLHLGDNLLNGGFRLPWKRLSSLLLQNNSFEGPLPIPLTPFISTFDVRQNRFNGSISPSICQLTSLLYLHLGQNNLTGVIPPCLGNLTDLQILGLSNNYLTGEISSLTCIATNLLFLDLSSNGITGTLPRWMKNITTRLVYLNLRMNKFHGSIPDIFPEGCGLTSIDFSKNQFDGSLPRSLSNCKGLGALDVGSNKIVDSFPAWLGDIPLKVLSLRSNNFRGHLSVLQGTRLFSNLRILDLSDNGFKGNLSDNLIGEMFGMARGDGGNAIGYMTDGDSSAYYSVMIDLKGVETEMVKIYIDFATLDMSSNHFGGEIPRNIGLLKSLKGLNLSHNCFTGTIPPSVGNLTNLESLVLSSNHLVGGIPRELAQLTSLGALNLSRNNLTGPIPSGGHFNTFPNSSFDGNPRLCGIPLARVCDQGHSESQRPQNRGGNGEDKPGRWLDWKFVAMGFGSGLGIGISLGYMVLEIGRPLWLARMVILLEGSSRKRSKRKAPRRYSRW